MTLTLQALSITMTFDEPVEREDDLTALPVFPMNSANGWFRGHSTITAIDYSDDGHTVTLTLDVGDIATADPAEPDEPDESTP